MNFDFLSECANYGERLQGEEISSSPGAGALDPGACEEACRDPENAGCAAWSFDLRARACLLTK